MISYRPHYGAFAGVPPQRLGDIVWEYCCCVSRNRSVDLLLREVHCGFEVGTAEVGAGKVGAAEVGVLQVGTAEVGTAEVRLFEAAKMQVGAAEVGAGKVGVD